MKYLFVHRSKKIVVKKSLISINLSGLLFRQRPIKSGRLFYQLGWLSAFSSEELISIFKTRSNRVLKEVPLSQKQTIGAMLGQEFYIHGVQRYTYVVKYRLHVSTI